MPLIHNYFVGRYKMNAKLKSNLLIVLGAFMVAIAVYFFLTPTNMTIGGATGIAIVLSYLLNLPMSYVLLQLT